MATPKKNKTILAIVLLLLILSSSAYFVYSKYFQPKNESNSGVATIEQTTENSKQISNPNTSQDSNSNSQNSLSSTETTINHNGSKKPWFSINLPQGWTNDPSIDPEGVYSLILFPSEEDHQKALSGNMTGDVSDDIRIISGYSIPSGLRATKYIDEATQQSQKTDTSSIKPATHGPAINKTLSRSKVACYQIFYDVNNIHTREVICGALYQDNSQGEFKLNTNQTNYSSDIETFYNIIDSVKIIDNDLGNYKNL
jgi:hypothetical protein